MFLSHILLDIDECTENPSICGNGTCVNIEGSHHCVCDQGFHYSPDEVSCLGMSALCVIIVHYFIPNKGVNLFTLRI